MRGTPSLLLTALCAAGGPWTGASMNPARVLAGLIVYQVRIPQQPNLDTAILQQSEGVGASGMWSSS